MRREPGRTGSPGYGYIEIIGDDDMDMNELLEMCLDVNFVLEAREVHDPLAAMQRDFSAGQDASADVGNRNAPTAMIK